MKKTSKMRMASFLLLASIYCLYSPIACDINADESSGDDNNTDGDSGTDTDSDSVGNSICENYPTSDDNFDHGSIVTNYLFYDKDNNEIEMCEFADEGNKLLMMKIGTGT